MKIRTKGHLCAAACLLVSLYGPGCNNNPTNAPAPLTDKEFGQHYKFVDNELPGWVQASVADAFTVWKGDSLIGIIDGGAGLYLDRGCQMSMYQNLVGPNGPDAQVCLVVAMLCGTNAQADSIFTYMQENIGSTVAVPQYDTTAVFAHPGVSGNITGYAHFKTMYYELQLSGYDSRDSSLTAATQMFKILESKTK